MPCAVCSLRAGGCRGISRMLDSVKTNAVPRGTNADASIYRKCHARTMFDVSLSERPIGSAAHCHCHRFALARIVSHLSAAVVRRAAAVLALPRRLRSHRRSAARARRAPVAGKQGEADACSRFQTCIFSRFMCGRQNQYAIISAALLILVSLLRAATLWPHLMQFVRSWVLSGPMRRAQIAGSSRAVCFALNQDVRALACTLNGCTRTEMCIMKQQQPLNRPLLPRPARRRPGKVREKSAPEKISSRKTERYCTAGPRVAFVIVDARSLFRVSSAARGTALAAGVRRIALMVLIKSEFIAVAVNSRHFASNASHGRQTAAAAAFLRAERGSTCFPAAPMPGAAPRHQIAERNL